MFPGDRRKLFKSLGLAFLSAGLSAGRDWAASTAYGGASSDRIDYSVVKGVAQKLATNAYTPSDPLRPGLRNLDYDQYRLIAFRHERAVWRDQFLPYWVEFYHPGSFFGDKVECVLVKEGRAQTVPFDPGLFQYRGELSSLKVNADLGFAGFRLLCRLPSRPQYQEFCSFLGASYFRAICTNQVYGASARGLAVNIGLEQPEEFPAFRKFWIHEPSDRSQPLRAWALLDGPSVTGAYEFLIQPGLRQTSVDVSCQLFLRKSVTRLGIAPLTSMWMWNETGRPEKDPRPEVHDSDGLLIQSASGEWLWRPLVRPNYARVNKFPCAGLRGFGLIQRERDFTRYRDDEAKYHLRPNIWITPANTWNDGAVELLELPSISEGVDNIAAYWNPGREIKAGESLELSYRISFANDEPQEHTGGVATRTAVKQIETSLYEFCVDWASDALSTLDAAAPLEPVVTCTQGHIAHATCAKQPHGVWQMRFQLRRDPSVASDLRAFVRRGTDTLSETWSYLWN